MQDKFDKRIIALANVPEAAEFKEYLESLNLPVLSTTDVSQSQNSSERREKAAVRSMVIRRNIRPNESIYAEGQSLCILGNVPRSAQVMADESIAVLGSLTGTAVAGLRGSSGSSITALHFNAHSVGIAEHRLLQKQITDFGKYAGQPTCVHLTWTGDPLSEQLHLKLL
jgi:septum formation inhibitor MinC